MIQRAKGVLKQIAVRALAHPRVCTVVNPLTGCLGTVFMLHRFEDPDRGMPGYPVAFVGQVLEHLRRRNCPLVSLRDLIDGLNRGSLPLGHSVAFTFDDGTYDQAEIAAPVFSRYDCPVTVFLITGFVDNKLWPWDDRVAYAIQKTTRTSVTVQAGRETLSYDLRTDARRAAALDDLRLRCKLLPQAEFHAVLERLPEATSMIIPEAVPNGYAAMTWDDARVLERGGLFSFAPHSVSHQILPGMADDAARSEITESWQRLQQELSNPLPVFNFPSGRFGVREVGFVRDAGFFAFVTTEAGYVYSCRDTRSTSLPWRLDRFVLPDTLEDFLQYSTWIEWGKQWVRSKMRLL